MDAREITVSELDVKKAIKEIMLRHKLIVEGSGLLAFTGVFQQGKNYLGK